MEEEGHEKGLLSALATRKGPYATRAEPYIASILRMLAELGRTEATILNGRGPAGYPAKCSILGSSWYTSSDH